MDSSDTDRLIFLPSGTLTVNFDGIFVLPGHHMLTDTELRSLNPQEKAYKKAHRDGMYVSVGGTVSFRYDYRLNGRRETLTIGRYEGGRAKSSVERGISPSWAKVEKRAIAN